MAHLRNVLVTPTHKDARVTAFLVTWAYEKFWIADALPAIVEANGGGDAATRRSTDGAPGGAASGMARDRCGARSPESRRASRSSART